MNSQCNKKRILLTNKGRTVKIEVVVFWDVTPEDGGSKVLRNVRMLPQHNMVSEPIRPRLELTNEFTGYGRGDEVQFLPWAVVFLFTITHPFSYLRSTEGVKRPKREADHHLIKFKNGWSFTSSHSMRLHDVMRYLYLCTDWSWKETCEVGLVTIGPSLPCHWASSERVVTNRIIAGDHWQ
jgi:hypothetical protein